jgi:hypothetical protein
VYSQNKLSRISEGGTDQPIIHKGYKEIDLLYGSEVRNNNNLEFRYTEPKKLQEIEKFFVEFYISVRNSNDIFHDNDIKRELKYFDYSIVKTIFDISQDKDRDKDINSIDMMIKQINLKLYEIYQNVNCNGANQIISVGGDVKDHYLRNAKDTKDGMSLFVIDRDEILKDLFKNTNNDGNSLLNEDRSYASVYVGIGPSKGGEHSKITIDKGKLEEVIEDNNNNEFIVTNGRKFLKEQDGWLVRKDSAMNNKSRRNNIEQTLSLSKMEEIQRGIPGKKNVNINFNRYINKPVKRYFYYQPE